MKKIFLLLFFANGLFAQSWVPQFYGASSPAENAAMLDSLKQEVSSALKAELPIPVNERVAALFAVTADGEIDIEESEYYLFKQSAEKLEEILKRHAGGFAATAEGKLYFIEVETKIPSTYRSLPTIEESVVLQGFEKNRESLNQLGTKALLHHLGIFAGGYAEEEWEVYEDLRGTLFIKNGKIEAIEFETAARRRFHHDKIIQALSYSLAERHALVDQDLKLPFRFYSLPKPKHTYKTNRKKIKRAASGTDRDYLKRLVLYGPFNEVFHDDLEDIKERFLEYVQEFQFADTNSVHINGQRISIAKLQESFSEVLIPHDRDVWPPTTGKALADTQQAREAFAKDVLQHVRENAEYPDGMALYEISENPISYVLLGIGPLGELKKLQLLNGVHPALDDELIKTLSVLPPFQQPPSKNGEPSYGEFVLPIRHVGARF